MTDETRTTTYTYDTLGRLTTVTDGSGDSVGYSYDARGNLTDWDSRTTSYSWTRDGQLDTRTDPNGITYADGKQPPPDTRRRQRDR